MTEETFTKEGLSGVENVPLNIAISVLREHGGFSLYMIAKLLTTDKRNIARKYDTFYTAFKGKTPNEYQELVQSYRKEMLKGNKVRE